MKRNARKAYNALNKIGAPVIERPGNDTSDGYFVISAESNYDEIWADYYDGPRLERVLDDGTIEWAFGVNPKINKILEANGLISEWINPGMLGVWDA